MVRWENQFLRSLSMSTATPDALKARVQTLIDENGRDYAQMKVREARENPATAIKGLSLPTMRALDTLASGQLTEADLEALGRLLQATPVLLKPDDNSDEWVEGMFKFFAQSLQHLENRFDQAKPAPAGKEAQQNYLSNFEQALATAKGRERNFFHLLATKEEAAAQGFRSKVSQDTTRWHNALTYLALTKASEELAPLLLATADLLKAGSFESLLGAEEIEKQVLVSSPNWVKDKYADKENFRINLAFRLGEMLEIPEERARVENALKAAGSSVTLPVATPLFDREATIAAFQEKARGSFAKWNDALREAMSEIPNDEPNPFALATPAFFAMEDASTQSWVRPETWLMMARQFPTLSTDENDDSSMLFTQLMVGHYKAHLFKNIDLAVAFPKPPEATEEAAKPKRPAP